MRNQKYIIIALVVVILALGGFYFLRSSESIMQDRSAQSETSPSVSPSKPAQGQTSGDLIDREWVWVETTFSGSDPVVPLGEKQFILTFSADGRISARTDCNTFIGAYTTSGENGMTIDAQASTLMACIDDTIQQDVFMEQLNRTTTYELTEEGLNLGLSDSSQMHFH